MDSPNIVGNEELPQTPKEAEGELTPKETPSPVAALTPEEEIELTELREIKATTGFKKFSESAREAQSLLERNKELEEKLLKNSENSFEKNLVNKYPDWDVLTDTEKARIKDQERQSKELADIKENIAWEQDFAKAKVKFPKLAEKEDEFKAFCYKYPKGIDAETLAKSFLFEEAPVAPPTPRKGLEKPSGGPNKVLSPEMSLEDITRLRTESPKLYFKMIREGRLNKIPEK